MHAAAEHVLAAVVMMVIIASIPRMMRCSGWQLCKAGFYNTGTTALNCQPAVPAMLTPAAPSLMLMRLRAYTSARPTHKPVSSLVSRQLRTTPLASSSSSSPDPVHAPHKSAFDSAKRLLRVIRAAMQALVAAALLVAVSPYLLSTKWGTSTASSVASRVFQGDVKVERISLGWAQPIAVEGVTVHEGTAGSSRRLFSLERLSSAEPLYAVCRGRGLTVTLAKPIIDCSLDDTGETLRLMKFAEAARLLNIITGSSGSSSSSDGGGVLAQQQQSQLQPQQQRQQQQGDAAADGGASSSSAGARLASGESRKASHRHHKDNGSNHTAGSVQSHPILTSAADVAAVEAEPPPAAALSPMWQRLTQADAAAALSAEFRLPQVAVYVPDGQVLLPTEVKAALGSHIHAIVAAGADQVVDLAEELDEDCSWLNQQQQQQLQQQQQKEGLQQQQPSGTAGNVVPAAAVAGAGWPVPPRDVSSRTWQSALPVMLQVSGEHVNGLVRGWRIGSGSYLLQQPAQVEWEFTAELARLTLSQFNPLLEGVVSVKEGGRLVSSYSPADGQLPATTGQVDVTPMKLQMGHGQLLKQVYKLLDISQSSGFIRRPWLVVGEESRSVEVWTGPLHVMVEGPGRYRTSRTDMIIGSGSSALHLAVWGAVDTARDALDMRIGLPASTLLKAGIKNLPNSYVLPIAVTGRLDKPQIDWPVAVRKLAVLSAMQLGRDALRDSVAGQKQQPGTTASVQQGLAGLFGVANRALTNAASSFIGQVDQRLQQELQEVPPAAALPWEQQWHGSYEQQEHQLQQQEGQAAAPHKAAAAAAPEGATHQGR